MQPYGTILSDLTKPFENRTQLYQYVNHRVCPYVANNLFHPTLPNANLVQIESSLKNINKPLSRIPSINAINYSYFWKIQ